MVPLWAAILIGLGSGLIGTVARISYERTAELRTRMIEADDGFSASVFRALAAWRDVIYAVEEAEKGETESATRVEFLRDSAA
jgi:hypothetical protein